MTSSTKRSLIHKVCKLSPAHTGGKASKAIQLHAIMQWCLTSMHPQNCLTPTPIGQRNSDLPIKPARPQKRRIKYVNAVCCCQHNHRVATIEPIKLDEQLIERLSTLSTICQTNRTLATNGINFI